MAINDGTNQLLQAWQKIGSHKDALIDIIMHLRTVFDAGKLNWFKQAIHIGLQIDSETKMPTCFEALLEQGREQGLLIGRIRTLQEVLGQTVASEDVLVSLPLETLQTLAAQLQESLATRPLHPGNG